MKLNKMITQYLLTALQASVDNANEPLGKNYDINDLPESEINKAIKDCNLFLAKCEENSIDISDISLDDLGHDFWLTRNRHGAGFWDGDYLPQELGEALTEVAHSFGECSIYIGDDGQLYFS